MNSTPIIDAAKEILTKDDEHRKYGDLLESTEKTAKVASVLYGKEVPTELVTMIYIAGKICRQGYSPKDDNLIDLVGYTEILNHIMKNKDEEQKR